MLRAPEGLMKETRVGLFEYNAQLNKYQLGD